MKILSSKMMLVLAYNSLCRHDRRSTEFKDQLEYLSIEEIEEDTEEPRDNCVCYNCFYGRDELAIIIINLIKGNKQHENNIELP